MAFALGDLFILGSLRTLERRRTELDPQPNQYGVKEDRRDDLAPLCDLFVIHRIHLTAPTPTRCVRASGPPAAARFRIRPRVRFRARSLRFGALRRPSPELARHTAHRVPPIHLMPKPGPWRLPPRHRGVRRLVRFRPVHVARWLRLDRRRSRSSGY